MLHRLDVDAYLARIGYAGPREPSGAVLDALHEAHVSAIPFENLDVRLHRPISLALPALEDKIVRQRRGGYCFEQNALFAAVLGEMGFAVQTLEARVRGGVAFVRPRTHMTLVVALPGGPRLCDVGFGSDGPLRSVPLDEVPSRQGASTFRVVGEEGDRVLQAKRDEGWSDLYVFSSRAALPVDYEVANHYTATWPRSGFVQTPTVQWTRAGERHVLRGRVYERRTAEGVDRRQVTLDEAVHLVRQVAGIPLDEEDVVRALGPTISPASDQAILVGYDRFSPRLQEDIARLVRVLRGAPPRGLVDLHPGYGSLLVRYDPRRTDPAALEEEVRARLVLSWDDAPAETGRLVEIPVVYGGVHGPDLLEVAREAGVAAERVIELHADATYRVAFLGFTAGFPYLSGLPDALSVARLPSPRRLVPAGSVAIAGRQAGIYPQATPGGWRLLGRTPLRLFRPEADPITLLRMGDRVRFVPQPAP
jgi:N-hydroxyarylamine O-acetyltransferase